MIIPIIAIIAGFAGHMQHCVASQQLSEKKTWYLTEIQSPQQTMSVELKKGLTATQEIRDAFKDGDAQQSRKLHEAKMKASRGGSEETDDVVLEFSTEEQRMEPSFPSNPSITSHNTMLHVPSSCNQTNSTVNTSNQSFTADSMVSLPHLPS